jgi:hypothetical protein
MQNDLAQFIDESYNNITYEGTCDVVLKNGKPTESWMKDWTQEQRFDKFFEWCKAFDKREDKLLKEDYQIFSHRLHWHEHPFVDVMKPITDNKLRLFYTLVFSFSNEHWGTLMSLMNDGIILTRERFKTQRHARNDLFQIYYPKGTNVKEWLIDGPMKAAEDIHTILDEPAKMGRPFTMMEFAKRLEAYFKEHQGFRSPLYPCKNTARYMAFAYPHLVDPESVLFGGTGHFDGMQQIFGGTNLNGKVKYEIGPNGEFTATNKYGIIWLEQMNLLANDTRNPMTVQKMLNVEDKTCFFYKHIAISHGVKSPTKRIPYTWIFPKEFSLKK